MHPAEANRKKKKEQKRRQKQKKKLAALKEPVSEPRPEPELPHLAKSNRQDRVTSLNLGPSPEPEPSSCTFGEQCGSGCAAAVLYLRQSLRRGIRRPKLKVGIVSSACLWVNQV